MSRCLRRVVLFPLLALWITPVALAMQAPVEWVDPLVGTQGDHGQLTPAVGAPFGLVQLGPDTQPGNHMGYDHADGLLRGFSHTRAVGVGCGGGGGDLLVRVDYAGDEARPAPIDKTSESAAPGRYHLRYGHAGIQADLAATNASGIARFTLPRAGSVVVTLDPMHAYSRRIDARWEATAANALRGALEAGTVCDEGVYRLWFASALQHNGRVLTTSAQPDADRRLRFVVEVAAGDTLELRSAFSTVDADSAARVLDQELGPQSLQEVQAATHAAWNAALSRIELDGGDDARRALFYTSLFHVLQSPSRIDDVDGRYRAADGVIRQVEEGHHRYSGWAIWDNYRTQLPLLALIDPARSADIAASLAELYAVGKPQWATRTEPFITVRTEHAGIALLDFLRKGIGGVDAKALLQHMVEESTRLQRRTPDQIIEAAYDDWAVWQLAQDLGERSVARDFRQRALSYRPMWLEVFRDIAPDFDTVRARGLYQGTLWQYRWAGVFDLEWLRDQALGPARFDAQLQQFFDENRYNMTNQPDIQVPALYAITATPSRGQALVERLLTQPIDHPYANEGNRKTPWHGRSFALDPVGFADGMDDDAGCMSAWYLWNSMGLYPLVLGQPRYVVSAVPVFSRLRIHPHAGRTITIERSGQGQRVTHVAVNGHRKPLPWIDHAALARGGTLRMQTDH
ncbi:MAG: glycoside hydrolase domain-containing protein [Pseudoxanthomonas sp.]